jgi:hypothetical protein
LVFWEGKSNGLKSPIGIFEKLSPNKIAAYISSSKRTLAGLDWRVMSERDRRLTLLNAWLSKLRTFEKNWNLVDFFKTWNTPLPLFG